MVYLCTLCNVQAPSISALCTHIRFVHPHSVLGSFDCGQCPRQYSSLKCLRKHLHKQHALQEQDNQPHQVQYNPAQQDDNHRDYEGMEAIDQDYGVEHNNEPGIENIENITVLDLKTALYESALALSAKLYATISLNRSQVQEIIDLMSDFATSGFLNVLKQKILMVVGDGNENVQEIMEMVAVLQDPFVGLQTERQRMAALKQSESFIQPDPYVIGMGEEVKYVAGHPVLNPIELKGQFISMKQTLKHFFELPEVFSKTQTNIANLKASAELSNIIQSPLWQNIEGLEQFQNKLVYPLLLYYDDVEPDNSLSSHSGTNKLGAVYYQVPCIPQHLTSCLENIFVAAVFLYSDRVLNAETAFHPVLESIIDLETNGIQIQVDGTEYTLYFALTLFLGDNLGIHSVTGFVESFSANFFCRKCKAHRNLTRHLQREQANLLRNRQNYAQDLTVNDYSLTGIKRECMWNASVSFNAVENQILDLMHDFLEGVCHYDLSIVLLALINNNFFNLETLNERVQQFDYQFDSANKPVLITMEHLRNEKLKMSASEMLFFVRNLGLMIGDLIPDGIQYWKLYTYLAEILDIVTAPIVNRNNLPYLATIIAEHHEVYCLIFNKTLKPKHHFMTHYPTVLNHIGPLIHVWAMRMEGLHRPIVKQSARSHNCRKNLPVSIAMRYVLSLSSRVLAKRGFPKDAEFHFREVNISETDNFEEFQYFLPEELRNSVVVKEATVLGTLYKQGMVLAIHYENELPLFGKINWIVKPLHPHQKAIFILSGYDTVGFSEHFHAFIVRPAAEWFVKEYMEIVSIYPSKCRVGGDGSLFVTLKHVL